MEHNQPQKFSQIIALQLKRLKEWVEPDPRDNVALRIIKTVMKSLAVLLMVVFSPVLLIGLALGFIGLM